MAAPGYIRGGGAGRMRAGKLIAVVALGMAAALGCVAAALAVSSAGRNGHLGELRRHGVAVQAVVTGCVATSSGIGMSVEYWTCRASYSLDGHTFDEVINGERALLERGELVEAVAVPGHPTLLSTPAVLSERSGGYGLAIALGCAALLVATVGGLAARSAGRDELTRRQHGGEGDETRGS